MGDSNASPITKKNSAKRILVGVGGGFVVLIGIVWVLAHTLGDTLRPLYAGKPLDSWQQQLSSHDPAASNEAFTIVTGQVIPQLTNILFNDTNDSSFRLSLISTLNGLPGVRIYYLTAQGRRIKAAQSLGDFGPVAKSAVPALIQTVKGNDERIHEAAVRALGSIHSDPDVVIPFLTSYLDNDDLNDEAATALGNYGSLAKSAVPKIIPLLHASDDDAQAAAHNALLQIDPEAAAKAGIKVK